MSGPALSAWTIDAQQFPHHGSFSEQVGFLLRYAILAPSSHNSQPWRFKLDDESLLLSADRTRGLPAIDPYDRELIISCGAALMNLRVAMAHFGCSTEIHTFPYKVDPDALALLQPNAAASCDKQLAQLLPAIMRRTTNRRTFETTVIPAALLELLVQAAAEEGVSLRHIETLTMRQRVAELIAEGDHEQFSDARFRRELANWIHGSRSQDGMAAYSFGVDALLDVAAPIESLVVRTFDIGDGMAAAHDALVRGSPSLVCLSTEADDMPAWLATGQAMQRILLIAAESGFDASFLNQIVELESLRHRLKELVGGAMYPQILLRLGKGESVPHSPRRPLADVLI